MSQTLQLIKELVARGEVRISEHGYDELTADDISVGDVLYGIAEAELVEDYPEYFKGPKRSRPSERRKWSTDSCSLGNPEGSSNASRSGNWVPAAAR